MTRQSRSNMGWSPRAKSPDGNNVIAKGVFNNSPFMHLATSLVGNTVQIHTQNGSVFEGIFKTFSTEFDVVLEVAHKVHLSNPSQINVDSVIETLIFKTSDIVTMEAIDVDLEYATRGTFLTDTAISKFNGQPGEKELEPWEETTSNGDDFDLNDPTMKGGNVNNMLKKNGQGFVVTSTFDQSLQGYTVPLQKQNTEEFKEMEAKDAQIANEIPLEKLDIKDKVEGSRSISCSRVKDLIPLVESTSDCNDFGLNGAIMKGWDGSDMFKKNEQAYRVISTFDQSFQGNTIPLQKQDTKEFKEDEAKSGQIANEIENDPNYKARIELENGDEEERYAAVARPTDVSNDTTKPYMLLAKRKHQQIGKFIQSNNLPSQPIMTRPLAKLHTQSPMSQHNPRVQQPSTQPALLQQPPLNKPMVQSPVTKVPSSPVPYSTFQETLQGELINLLMDQQITTTVKPLSGLRTGRRYRRSSPAKIDSDIKPPLPISHLQDIGNRNSSQTS